MKASLFLTDAAHAVGGKVYALGLGWTTIRPDGKGYAIVLDVKVGWEEANRKHRLRLELLDAHGNGVVPAGAAEPRVIEGEFECAPRVGVRPGMPLGAPIVVPVPPMELEPSSYFEWKLWIDDETKEDWFVPFATADIAEAKAA